MPYITKFRNVHIEAINPKSLYERYQSFLDTLDYEYPVEARIISVNYGSTAYRLEGDVYDAGIIYTVLATYTVRVWEDKKDEEQ